MAQQPLPLDEHLLNEYFGGKMNRAIYGVHKRLAFFIRKSSVIIEDVHERVKMMGKMEFGKITKEFMEASLRDDMQEAGKSLNHYDRTYRSIEFWLTNLNSSYNLGKFLRDNGVPPGNVYIQAQTLKDLWRVSYGKHLERFEKIKSLLLEMRAELAFQIKTLGLVEKTNFLEGISEHSQINESFERERALFWELVKISKVTRVEQRKLSNALGAEITKAQAIIQAKRGIMNRDFNTDMKDRNLMERQVVRLTYTLGAVALIADIPDEMIKKGIGKPLDWLLGRNKKGLSESGTMIRNQLVKGLRQLSPI